MLFLDILPNDDETNEQRNRSTGTGSGAIARYVRAQKSTSEEGSSRTNAFSQGLLLLPNNTTSIFKKKVSVVLVSIQKKNRGITLRPISLRSLFSENEQ